jgi:hypothetical protein
LGNGTAPPPERFCPGCGRSFVSDRRRIWCSDACRQRGFRLRRQPADEAPLLLPRRLPKDAIVYVCPECEPRYLGAQRGEGCGTFCRRLGPGAPCPHCDEPVALSDLVTTAPAP